MGGISGADRYDLIVVGGGSAGLTAAGFAARIGAKVLIAAEQLGGDCTWTGCVPSKALIRTARLAHDLRRGGAAGIQAREVSVDFARVMAEVRAVIMRVYSYETADALGKRGIEVAVGDVRFLDRETVQAGERRVQADHFVVCTGAGPFIPPIAGLESLRYLTHETVFDLERLPQSMIIVGAGATGVEIAQALARLGCKVTLVEQRSSVLPEADPDAAAVIRRRLESEGVTILTSAAITQVAAVGGRALAQVGTSHVEAEALLVAAGRKPRVAGLGLEEAGIRLHDGAILVNDNLRTTNPLVYAAGDVTGGFQFTHYAGWQGYAAARNALLPGSQKGFRSSIPWAVFTDPEVAQAGLNEQQGRAQFSDAKVHRLELERVDRAQTEDERDGFIKLLSSNGGKLVGATVVSRAAGEIVNELALAIDHDLTVADLAASIHAYPTFGFGIQQLAAEAALETLAGGVRGRAIRALRRLS